MRVSSIFRRCCHWCIGLKCMARTMKIKGSDAMNMPGTWKVQLYYNNEMLVEQSFEIQERCAAQAALHDDTQA